MIYSGNCARSVKEPVIRYSHKKYKTISRADAKDKEDKEMTGMNMMSTEELNVVNGGVTLWEFQDMYPTREEREAVLVNMPDEEIQEIIDTCGTIQCKIYYSQFMK